MIHFLQNYPKIILFLKLFLFFTLSFNSIIDADNYLKQQNFSETNFSTQESHRSRSDLSNDSESFVSNFFLFDTFHKDCFENFFVFVFF